MAWYADASRNVRPKLAANNLTDLVDANAKNLGKSPSTLSLAGAGANVFHFVGRQFTPAISLAARNFFRMQTSVVFFTRQHALWMSVSAISLANSSTALFHHILHVIGMVSDPQVIGVHAGADVATVANKQTLWDMTLREPVRKSMGRNAVPRSGDKDAVPAFADASIPEPAIIRSATVDKAPETRGSVGALSGTVTSAIISAGMWGFPASAFT